ncbi:MAG: flagellar assembly protein FliH [Methylobacterium sp.]|nr:flagellar assembly protein FliH [Methylobacterium sp.]
MAETRNAFNFQRDFSQAAATSMYLEKGTHLPVPYAQHARLLEQAHQEAYARGLQDGRQQQRDDEANRIADALAQIANQLRSADEQLRSTEADSRKEALYFAQVFARKLAGKLIEQMPVAPIEATARAILNDLRGAPHVAVRVEPSLLDDVKSRLVFLLRENGINLKLFVFPDPAVRSGDCRIEWAEGGIVREREKLEYLIEQSLDIVLKRGSL